MEVSTIMPVVAKFELSLGGCPVGGDSSGDGFCDDITNNKDCNYDGGDCCGPDVNTQFCTECQCLGGQGANFFRPYILGGLWGCAKPDWVGDGFCDDFTNNLECTYDGGDCCRPDVDTKYCQECQCLNYRFGGIQIID